MNFRGDSSLEIPGLQQNSALMPVLHKGLSWKIQDGWSPYKGQTAWLVGFYNILPGETSSDI